MHTIDILLNKQTNQSIFGMRFIGYKYSSQTAKFKDEK